METTEITLSYRAAHIIISGVGGLLQYFGAPPDDARDMLIKLVAFTTEDSTFDVERADETHTFEFTRMQLDVMVSAAAMFGALTFKGLVTDNPHTMDQVQEVGEHLSQVLLDRWPEMITRDHAKALRGEY